MLTEDERRALGRIAREQARRRRTRYHAYHVDMSILLREAWEFARGQYVDFEEWPNVNPHFRSVFENELRSHP